MKDTEYWKLFAADSRYEISNHGRVRNTVTKRIRNCSVGAARYKNFVVTYRGTKKVKCFDVHVAVALTWIGSRPPKFDVSHIDGNRLNNRADNLIYESRSDNMKRKGVKYFNGLRKLTAEIVLAIRHSDEPGRILAERYAITRGTVWKIRKNLLWKHLI